MGFSAQVLARSPLAYWRLGEASGTTAADSSGNGRNGTYVNTPGLGNASLIVGDSDTAMSTGVSAGQCMSVANAAWMNVSSISVVCRVKITSGVDGSNGDAIVTRYSASGFPWLLWRNTSGKFAVQINAAVNVADAASVTLGQTYTVGFTYDQSNIRLYVDGVQVASTAYTTALAANTSPIEVGRYSGATTTVPDAVFDEVAIWGSALTADDMAVLHSVATIAEITGSLGITSLLPDVEINASVINPEPATLALESPLPSAEISATYLEPIEASLDITAPVPSMALSATFYTEPIAATLACEAPVPTMSLAVSQRMFVPPTTTEHSDDPFFGRYQMTVGQSVVLTDGHYETTPYPWLGEIADLEEGVEWFQGGRSYHINATVAAALLADGYTLTEV